jgi:hypothetical protein
VCEDIWIQNVFEWLKEDQQKPVLFLLKNGILSVLLVYFSPLCLSLCLFSFFVKFPNFIELVSEEEDDDAEDVDFQVLKKSDVLSCVLLLNI